MKKYSKDISIVISVGSPKSTLKLVTTTIESIRKNIGTGSYQMIIYVGQDIDYSIKEYLWKLKEEDFERIILLQNCKLSWAQVINQGINLSGEFKYFLISHDDVELLTPNFFQEVENELNKIKDPVGFVSFLDMDFLNGNFAPSTREGFHKDVMEKDAWKKRKVFQFHRLKNNWLEPSWISRTFGNRIKCLKKKPSKEYFKFLKYDIPFASVKCHSPFSHFILIEMDKLKQIGFCEEWNDLSLLVDEDFGLRALQLNFQNILMSNIRYIHNRGVGGGTRAWNQIKEQTKNTEELFFKKWGFHVSPTLDELKIIQNKYNNTLIPWSIEKDSYDWEYTYFE